MPGELGRLLTLYQPYLRHVAAVHLPADLNGKVDGSDVIQETFLEAQRDFGRFAGSTEGELIAWLRRALERNIANVIRHYRDTAKRAIDREVTVDPHRLETISTGTTPGSEVSRRERDAALESALDRLSPHYRQVIRWRNYDRLSFSEIGSRLDRTAEAARRVWVRAIARLKEILKGEP
jgi:RNA polymerase sigma-70 factor (ECF subfamily)